MWCLSYLFIHVSLGRDACMHACMGRSRPDGFVHNGVDGRKSCSFVVAMNLFFVSLQKFCTKSL